MEDPEVRVEDIYLDQGTQKDQQCISVVTIMVNIYVDRVTHIVNQMVDGAVVHHIVSKCVLNTYFGKKYCIDLSR